VEEVLGPAGVSDRIRFEVELEEGLYQLKRETEAPGHGHLSLDWYRMLKKAKSMEVPRLGFS